MKLRNKPAKKFGILLAILFISIFTANAVSAQETRGTIRGTVTDSNKAAIASAAVKIIDETRGTNVTVSTNGEGFYQAIYLLPGTYQIVVETAGFKKYVRNNVTLQISQTIDTNIVLEVGTAQETVNVTTEAPPLETAKADLGLVVDNKRIAELPLVHGDPYTLIGLSTGVTYTGQSRLDRPFEPTHIIGFAVDGTRGNRSDLTIDGAPSTATANANEVIATYVPPSDIVQEFKVQTATFDAQFGNTEGGVTSISIKSGTNNLHGAAYLFKEPGNWAANDTFGKARGQARPDTFSNRYGGNVNGPVRIPWLYNGKDKTFFLFGYEGIRDSRPRFDAAATSWVPTTALRNGDFTGTGVTIYDPATRVLNANGSYSETAFVGNVIPNARISPVAASILKYYSLPKTAGTGVTGLNGNIFDSTLAETTDYGSYTFRVDQNITSKNRMFVRGSFYNRDTFYADYLGSAASGVIFLFKSRQGVIDDVQTFDANTVLNVKYSYNRFIRGADQRLEAQGFDLTSLGFPSYFNNFNSAGGRRFPSLAFSGGMLGTASTNEFRPVNTQAGSITLNKIINTHSFKFGGELRDYREDDSFASNDQTGAFTFDGLYTRQASATAGSTDVQGVQAFAQFLLGLPTAVNVVKRADYSEYSKTFGFFVQDDWKVSNKLSLNLGLRYEFETPLTERQNKSVSGFDFGYRQPSETQVKANITANQTAIGIDPNSINLKGGLLFAGKDTKSLYATPKNVFLPRFGVAYQLNDKTVIRGGIGMFAGFLGERRGDVIQPGYTRTTTAVLTTNANGAAVPFSLSNVFTNTTLLQPIGNALGKQTGLGGAITFFNPNPKVSKQTRVQIGIQRQLPFGFVFEAEYVGNFGRDIETSKNINTLPANYLNSDNFRSAAMTANNTYLSASVPNPFFGIADYAGSTFATSATISRSQLLLPYPEFGAITTSFNNGKSWYHAAQFNLQKRFSHGYTVGIGYTFSKWLQATEYLNQSDANPTKMISDQDSPHRISGSGMYALPFGKGQLFLTNANGIVDRIVGGWQLQGVYTYQTGFPISFSTDSFYNGGKITIDNPQVGNWFNTSVFTSVLNNTSVNATPVNHLRTLPIRFSDVRLDNTSNFDFSVIKDTQIKEKMKIQLRFELINAFNHPLLSSGLIVNPTSSTFGQISAANQYNYARRAQFGIKFLF